MAGYFNNHSQRIASTAPSGNHTSPVSHTPTSNPHPNSRLRAASSSSSKHFSTTVSSEERGRDKTSSSNGLANGAIGGHPVHPLRNTQQRAPSKIVDYESGIKKISAFASVESFWSLFTHLQPPSALQPTTDYLLFHAGVRRPVWEDPLNLSGGKWIVRLRKGVADRLWEDLVCAVVGDQFAEDGESGTRNAEGATVSHDIPAGPEICGCTISVRNSEDILSVWNKGTDAKINARIRDTIKRVLNLPPNIIMEYKTNSGTYCPVLSIICVRMSLHF
ncbi:translation initiation factor eIF 4e-like domain-containing protein [Gautieria morchelliformis]|nr:translation initiation factor eIF 4e-like domain-containing protein [Gautieria morchelliformis]